ncbi:hypothetical protein [Azotobacter armeniacus]
MGKLSLAMQTKLLWVLQEKSLERDGGNVSSAEAEAVYYRQLAESAMLVCWHDSHQQVSGVPGAAHHTLGLRARSAQGHGKTTRGRLRKRNLKHAKECVTQ